MCAIELSIELSGWQKGKDVNWYNKDKQDDAAEARRLEIKKIKDAEADALAVAL